MARASRAQRIGPLQVAIILATLFTAGVHVYLVVTPVFIRTDLRVLFLLAALGYLGTLGALYAPSPILERMRWMSRLALAGVAVGTIVGYFVVVGFTFSTLSLIDKLVEALLVLLLIADGAIASRG